MKEKKHYISLKFKGGNTFHGDGQRIKSTERVLNIGETADCDVRFEAEATPPEYYATIVKNDDGKSWRIVKRSQHIDIFIVGKGTIGYACRLADGDIIKFGNHQMSLCFHTHHDNRYDDDPTFKLWPIIALTIVFLMGVCGTFFLIGKDGKEKDICEEDVVSIQESVCLLKVDSVQQQLYVHGVKDSIIRSQRLDRNAPMGTAFLTTDGKLVTARHCVEFWLGRNIDLTTKVTRMPNDDVAKWAIETETFNRRHLNSIDSLMRMNVFFSIYSVNGEKVKSFSSSDSCVHINTAKDGVFLMADFDNDYYWRSIRPYFIDRRMAMGDILWIDNVTKNGKVIIASNEDMNLIKGGTRLVICGYPITGTGNKQMIPATGSVKIKPDIRTENIFFESNINHGYSGGPVLMKCGDNIVAIGIVSCVDSVSSGLFKWAVPVSEMLNN